MTEQYIIPIETVSVGTKVQVDNGFTCIDPWSVVEVARDDTGLYFPCCEGCHYLAGQLSDDGTKYVGIIVVPPRPTGKSPLLAASYGAGAGER